MPTIEVLQVFYNNNNFDRQSIGFFSAFYLRRVFENSASIFSNESNNFKSPSTPKLLTIIAYKVKYKNLFKAS